MIDFDTYIIKEAKDKLGAEKLRCLKILFESLEGFPPQALKKKYRVDHSIDIEILDELELNNNLIRCDNETSRYYSLYSYALPLISSEKAGQILQDMALIFESFKTIYKERTTDPVSFNEISERVGLEDVRLKIALFYMREMSSFFCGSVKEFPFEDGATVNIDERVIRPSQTITKCFDQYYEHRYNPNLGEPTFFSQAQGSDVCLLAQNDNQKPQWYSELSSGQQVIIDEIDSALKAGSSALPIMGIRALIENLMLDRIEDKNSFKNNLKEFSAQGYISQVYAEMIYKVIDAGSAVIHRGHIPEKSDVRSCVDAVKNLLHQVLVLSPRISEMHSGLPKRK